MAKRKANELKEVKEALPLKEEEDIEVSGLLDAGSDSDENEETDEETAKELDGLIGEEEDEEEESEGESDDSAEIDEGILKDLDGPVRVRSASDYESDDQVTYVQGADGKPRPLYPPIEPVYDSDDSDREEANTIGNIPLSAYDEMPHIGYDIDGKRIMRPATGSALDNLLESIDLPEGWTGLLDKNTGEGLKLSAEELDVIRKIQQGENPDGMVNPYEDTVEWFSSQKEVTPVTAKPEPKRRFVPSKHEAKRVMKIVRAIREGRIVPNKPPPSDDPPAYDLWADNAEEQEAHIMHLPAPKLPPPTHEESYNPPEEYLLDDKELEQWEKTDPNDRERNFVPKKYGSLRRVPAYADFVRERFERSLDLYLAPRIRHKKLNIDPDSLLPDLPSPDDLRPFPIKCATTYEGHSGRVRCLSVDPTGQFLATGGDDGTVRVWEILTGRELWRLDVLKRDTYENEEKEVHVEDHVEAIQWNPQPDCGLLAVAAAESIYLIVPPVFDIAIENAGRELIETGWGHATGGDESAKGNVNVDENEDEDDEEPEGKKKPPTAKWNTPTAKLAENGVGAIVRCKKTVKKLSWHRRGDYFVTVSPKAANSAVLVHQLSKHSTQSPFRKSRGIVQDAMFHPSRPHLYVATQRYVRVYDLRAQVMAKKVMPGVRWLSSFDIHPGGDNIITSSYDKRVTWHDMDLSDKPYKTLRYHDKAVRDVAFHKSLPLFCSASDDGKINIFHGMVYNDAMKNPLLVPLKILKGHKVTQSLGILNLVWHPKEAWLFSTGADGTAKLWTA
ncbi:hypothetical protein TRICI_002572 [Trichomonascus ciferrii]|uniref:Ribosome biogenesis protein ERB1 n=1 Tax=Trichomonascus ciferrii TaxID=44093 RepID=A0A642V6G2_9ASCO|nr:hypothetical protein TRICI_002572 [Trichomonascus ciferrii]